MHTVLVVENSDQFAGIVTAALRPQSQTVMAAGSAMEAYHLLRLNRPDVVIINLAMPRGPELLPIIRSIPGCEGLPIIGLSDEVPPEVVGRAERMGVRVLLSKADFTIERLQEHVAEIIEEADQPTMRWRGAA
jgi:CheY-like chemotaxis protein